MVGSPMALLFPENIPDPVKKIHEHVKENPGPVAVKKVHEPVKKICNPVKIFFDFPFTSELYK